MNSLNDSLKLNQNWQPTVAPRNQRHLAKLVWRFVNFAENQGFQGQGRRNGIIEFGDYLDSNWRPELPDMIGRFLELKARFDNASGENVKQRLKAILDRQWILVYDKIGTERRYWGNMSRGMENSRRPSMVQEPTTQYDKRLAYNSILQLAKDYGPRFGIGRNNQFISIITDPIELDDEYSETHIALGRFQICIMGKWRGDLPVEVWALEQNLDNGRPDIPHPNISGHKLCFGNSGMLCIGAYNIGDYLTLADTANSIINTYGNDNPYLRLKTWVGRPCRSCGETIVVSELITCQNCSREHCEQCSNGCNCGAPGCDNCMNHCQNGNCETRICDHCSLSCEECDREVCTSCGLETCSFCSYEACIDCIRTTDSGQRVCPSHTWFCDECGESFGANNGRTDFGITCPGCLENLEEAQAQEEAEEAERLEREAEEEAEEANSEA